MIDGIKFRQADTSSPGILKRVIPEELDGKPRPLTTFSDFSRASYSMMAKALLYYASGGI